MSSADDDSNRKKFGGLNAGNMKEINRRFICEFCTLLMLYPWQLLCCGALVCKYCILNGLSNSEPFICPFCQKKQPKKQALLDRGTERELKKITITCDACPWQGLYSDYLIHLQNQHANLECLDCHEHFFAINSLEEHRYELCRERSLPCGLPNCAKVVKWYDMKSHFLTVEHQRRLTESTVECIYQIHRAVHNSNHIQLYQDLSNSADIAVLTHEMLHNERVRLAADIKQREQSFKTNQSKIGEVNSREKDNERTLPEISEKMTMIQSVLDSTERIREEGNIFILDNNSTVTFRLDAPTTVPFSITTTKFKTSEYGYAFLMRVYSTIVQNNQNLSISLTLCNDDYYNILPFPFNYDIHVILLDQSKEQKHIKHILQADRIASSCNRPTREYNDEFGIDQLCSLQCLTDPQNAYVKDGVLFIQIFIDFSDTKKESLLLTNDRQNVSLNSTRMITD